MPDGAGTYRCSVRTCGADVDGQTAQRSWIRFPERVIYCTADMIRRAEVNHRLDGEYDVPTPTPTQEPEHVDVG